MKRFKFAKEEELAKGLVPRNTSKSTKWALNNFEAWMKSRNLSCPDIPVPKDLLMCSDPEILNLHLSRFVIETRKANGDDYPPSTLHQLLCGILRFMRECNPDCPNFLDKSDKRFRPLHRTLDSSFHKLHSEGVGRQTKHAEIISSDEECQLWESDVLNTTTTKGLQNAVFYTTCIGKTCFLCGGQEHRALKLSQLQHDGEKYVYYENVSKNQNGSFKQLLIKSKVVPVFPCPEAGERCPVHLLDKYISKLPTAAKEMDLFYVRPLDEKPQDPNMPWYSAVQANTHYNRNFKKMCADAGINGNKTNHSLGATGATELYKRGVPEKLIQERTGHHSLESLRTYERTSEEQHKAASSVLSASSHTGADYSHWFSSTKTKSINVHPVPFSSQGFVPVSFQNVQGCTINIMSAP